MITLAVAYFCSVILQSSFVCSSSIWDREGKHPGGGGGGTPLYKLYRDVPPHRVGFLYRFGLKTGIDFVHFGLESGVVFGGTTGVYERIYCFNSKWVRKKEKYANSKWI